MFFGKSKKSVNTACEKKMAKRCTYNRNYDAGCVLQTD